MNHCNAKSWSFHGLNIQIKIKNKEKWAKLVTLIFAIIFLQCFGHIFFEIKQKLILSDSIMTYDMNDIRGFK